MTSMMTARRGVMAKPSFSPSSLPGLAVWFDASQLTGLADGDPVASWTDLSGNARHAAQATSTKRPTYKTNIQNGKPVIRFDGVDDFLATPAWTNPTSLTAFVVVRESAVTTYQEFFEHAAGATWANPYAQYLLRSISNPYPYQGIINNGGSLGNAQGGTADTTVHAFALDVQPATGAVVYRDGVSIAGPSSTAAPITQTTFPLYIGNNTDGGEPLPGDMSELFIASAVSATTRASAFAYLKTKWGTP
jgi:hypothetical protein